MPRVAPVTVHSPFTAQTGSEAAKRDKLLPAERNYFRTSITHPGWSVRTGRLLHCRTICGRRWNRLAVRAEAEVDGFYGRLSRRP